MDGPLAIIAFGQIIHSTKWYMPKCRDDQMYIRSNNQTFIKNNPVILLWVYKSQQLHIAL